MVTVEPEMTMRRGDRGAGYELTDLLDLNSGCGRPRPRGGDRSRWGVGVGGPQRQELRERGGWFSLARPAGFVFTRIRSSIFDQWASAAVRFP